MFSGASGLISDVESLKQVVDDAVAFSAHAFYTQQQHDDIKFIQEGNAELKQFYRAVSDVPRLAVFVANRCCFPDGPRLGRQEWELQ
jgi:hypothetical protein